MNKVFFYQFGLNSNYKLILEQNFYFVKHELFGAVPGAAGKTAPMRVVQST